MPIHVAFGLVIALNALILVPSRHAAPLGVRWEKDLVEVMYPTLKGGDACVRLVYRYGTIGCSTEGQPAQGPLWSIDDDEIDSLQPSDIPPGSMLVVSAWSAEVVLSRLRTWSIAPAGLLIVPLKDNSTILPANPLPPSGSMLPNDGGESSKHVWNPLGSGSILASFEFAVLFLDPETADRAWDGAESNRKSGASTILDSRTQALFTAVADVRMASSPSTNSSECLAGSLCMPLGGHTVWAQWGHQNKSGPVVVLAHQDAPSFFHSSPAPQAAEASLSGLVAVLVAAKLVGQSRIQPSEAQRSVIFAALPGESWGHMGSRRLFYEAEMHGNKDAQALASASMVLEVGPVGRVASQDSELTADFYLHATSSLQHEEQRTLFQALEQAALAEEERSVQLANASVSGSPPGSASSSFQRMSPAASVVLTDYDATWASDAGTAGDIGETLDQRKVRSAAVLVARAALEASNKGSSKHLNTTGAGQAVADALKCVGIKGLDCPLAKALLGESAAVLTSYVGVLYSITADASVQDPMAKSDKARFLFAYLSYALSGKLDERQHDLSSEPSQRCSPVSRGTNKGRCPEGFVCAGSWAEGSSKFSHYLKHRGECLNVSAAFVPAYPTALTCDGCDGLKSRGAGWAFSDAAHDWEVKHDWQEEPVWMESNWPVGVPKLTTLLRPSQREETLTFWLGILSAVSCIAVVAIVKRTLQIRTLAHPLN